MLQMNSHDQARFARATYALLSPLDHAHVDDWRALVNHELCALLGADSAGFLLPTSDAAPMFSNEHSPEVLAAFPDFLPPPLSDGTPIWQRMIASGTATLDTMYGEDMPAYLASAYYNEYAAKGGGAETLASTMLVSGSGNTPVGAASLHLWHSRLGRRPFGDREVGLLSLLFPAFRAGVESWHRFAAARAAFLQMIDQLDQAAIVIDTGGSVLHETPRTAYLLAEDPDGATVHASMLCLGRGMALSVIGADAAPASRDMRTRSARYSLHGCRYTTGAGGAPLRVVMLKRDTPRSRTDRELRAEYGFTATESRVARMIGQGLRTSAIAAAIGSSVHTVKRHTERVMRKLSVTSRAEVGPRIA